MGKSSKAFSLSYITKTDGTQTSTTEEAMLELLHHHFPLDSTDNDTHAHRIIRNDAKTIPDTTDDKPFTFPEVLNILRTMKTGKSPGPDGLITEIIREIYCANNQLFLAILNECLCRGIFPDCWKAANLVLLNKGGKSKHDPSAYRPICLLSSWSKVLDKLITNRLYHFLLSNNLLSNKQFGFMPGKSTTQAISELLYTIRTNKTNNHHTCLISLDVQGAFSNVWWPHLLSKLNSYKCPKNLYSLFSSYLSDRSVLFTYGSTSLKHNYSKGCPQGSNSGPLLWNIVADAALSIPTDEGVTIAAYADDLIITIAASGRRNIEAKARTTLNLLENWSKSTKTTFCPHKTKMIIFPKGAEMKRKPTIHFQGHSIKTVKSLKYLGVTLDDKLTWIPHLSTIKAKCISITNMLNGMSKRTWGLNSAVKKAIYKRGIERLILYACGAWWSQNPTVKATNMLTQIQKISLLHITKCYRTVSTEALQTLAGTLPTDLIIGYEACIYRLTKENSDTNLWNIHLLSSDVEKLLPYCPSHPGTDLCVSWDNAPPTDSNLEIYTDGSKSTLQVGAAFCAFRDGALLYSRGVRLSPTASVFQAELHAISMALEWSHINVTSTTTLHIYSDSQSALSSLSNTNSRLHSVLNIRHQLETLMPRFPIAFHWTRGHTGVPGNEEADALSKQASQHNQVEMELSTPISYVKHLLHSTAVVQWQLRWTSALKGRHTAKLIPKVLTKRLKGDFLLNQLLTNHGAFPHYYQRFKLKNCHCGCGENHPDALHLVFKCNQLDQERRTFLPWQWNPGKLYENLTHPTFSKGLKKLMNFIYMNKDSLFPMD